MDVPFDSTQPRTQLRGQRSDSPRLLGNELTDKKADHAPSSPNRIDQPAGATAHQRQGFRAFCNPVFRAGFDDLSLGQKA